SPFTRSTATVLIAAEPPEPSRLPGLRLDFRILSLRREPRDDTAPIRDRGGRFVTFAEPPSLMRRIHGLARSISRPAAWTARRISRRPKTFFPRRNCPG